MQRKYLFIIGTVCAGLLLLCAALLRVSNQSPPQAQSHRPLTPGTTWQWNINGPIDETVLDASHNPKKMIDVDMEDAPKETIQRLKNKGITVVCYMEVGAWEDYRSDAKDFPAQLLGNPLDPPYENERYLDIRDTQTLQLITKRFDRAAEKGCQGVEPDIDDAYFEDFEGNYSAPSQVTGFPITYAQQVAFNTELARAAHQRGMSFGLKNGADKRFVKDLLPHIDWVLNEQCNESQNCDAYASVISAGKAVFQVEYNLEPAEFCRADNAAHFDGLKKDTDLTALPRYSCR